MKKAKQIVKRKSSIGWGKMKQEEIARTSLSLLFLDGSALDDDDAAAAQFRCVWMNRVDGG